MEMLRAPACKMKSLLSTFFTGTTKRDVHTFLILNSTKTKSSKKIIHFRILLESVAAVKGSAPLTRNRARWHWAMFVLVPWIIIKKTVTTIAVHCWIHGAKPTTRDVFRPRSSELTCWLLVFFFGVVYQSRANTTRHVLNSVTVL